MYSGPPKPNTFTPEQLIEWCEPYDPEAKYNLICRMTCQDVIDYQMNRPDILAKGYIYPSEQMALDNFMVVHWASFVTKGE